MWFSHPKPFITKAVAMQIAEKKTLPPPDITTIIVEHKNVPIPELKRQANMANDIAAPPPASGR